jgi:hypothetical protein
MEDHRIVSLCRLLRLSLAPVHRLSILSIRTTAPYRPSVTVDPEIVYFSVPFS